MLPLGGVKILDLTRLLPGALATQMLVDLGAEVVKVEDPHGGDYARWMGAKIDGLGVFFRASNRGKRSLILDLKHPDGVPTLTRLAAQADVLIEGFRPGVMDRLGCGAAALRAANPRLVYCAVSGWGAIGARASEAGHDLNYQAEAGLIGAAGVPQLSGGLVADVGGSYSAVAGILAALLQRERTGEGAFVDVSLAEAALPFVAYNWVEALTDGRGAGDGDLTGALAYYNVYRASDGTAVALAALEEKFFANFCAAIGRPEWLESHGKPDRQAWLAGELAALFAGRTAQEWDILLSGADCCFSVVRPPGEIHQSAVFSGRGALGVFEDGTPWLRAPIRLDGGQPLVKNAVPGYGQDTRDVLAGWGFSASEIDDLAESGCVKAG